MTIDDSLFLCVLVMMVCPCRLLVLVLTVLPVQAAGVERLSLAGLGPPPRLAGNSLNILLTIDLLPLGEGFKNISSVN